MLVEVTGCIGFMWQTQGQVLLDWDKEDPKSLQSALSFSPPRVTGTRNSFQWLFRRVVFVLFVVFVCACVFVCFVLFLEYICALGSLDLSPVQQHQKTGAVCCRPLAENGISRGCAQQNGAMLAGPTSPRGKSCKPNWLSWLKKGGCNQTATRRKPYA